MRSRFPVGEESFFELKSGWQRLPSPLDAINGLLISGNNHSDDLFMFIKRRVEGLPPNTRYGLRFEIEIATNADSGCAGIGCAPGEGVFATAVEPVAVIRSEGGRDVYRMNIDHGNQANGGNDAVVIGNVAGSQTDCMDDIYELKRLDSGIAPFGVQTDNEGGLWLVLATDSGFEGTTGIFFTDVRIVADPLCGTHNSRHDTPGMCGQTGSADRAFGSEVLSYYVESGAVRENCVSPSSLPIS